MLSKDKLKYPTEITDEQLRYLITAFENNMAEFYPVGREAEIARQLLSLREQLEVLKQQKPIGQVIRCNGNKTLGWINDAPEGTLLFTAAKPLNSIAIEDSLVEQVGLMCDEAVNINEKNAYGHAYCILKYGILPYLRNQGQ